MFHGFGPEGVFDFEDEFAYLTADEMKIVDAGDSDVISAIRSADMASALCPGSSEAAMANPAAQAHCRCQSPPNRRPVNETGAAQRP